MSLRAPPTHTPHPATAAKGATTLLLPHHMWGWTMLDALVHLGRSVRLRAAAGPTRAARVGSWGAQWNSSELLWHMGRLCVRAGLWAFPWVGVDFAYVHISPGQCERLRLSERLCRGRRVLWMSLKVRSRVGAAARACGSVRAAGSAQQAAAACELAQAAAALCGGRACCRAGSGTVVLRWARVPSGMRCGGCTHPRHPRRTRLRGSPACCVKW